MEEVTDEPLYRDQVCGIDIGKAQMVATIRVPSGSNPARRASETRSFGTKAGGAGAGGLAAQLAGPRGYAKWSDVKAKGRVSDPRTGEEQAASRSAAARERREAYVRGHQLAEMRTTAGVTQAELAEALGVSQARISKIEHGEISGIDVVRAYVAALGGSIDVVARLGDRS